MNTQRTIVVGVDASASAGHAAVWAADLASVRGRPLRLVHAVGPAESVEEPAWLREAADAAERLGAEVLVNTVPGLPADALLERAHDAGLVVVGSYGKGAAAGLLVGSTALQLVERAPCPVAVVRGTGPGLAPRRDGPVVVGVDSTEAAAAALEQAADLASALAARLLVVHAWSDVATSGDGPRRRQERWNELASQAQQTLDTLLAPLADRHAGLVVEGRAVPDNPLRALLVQATTARAIVVGRRERPPGPGMTLGSTSRGLVEFAACPVVVVEPGRAARLVAADRGAHASG